MKPLNSLKELQEYREKITQKLSSEDGKIRVKVHLGTCGISSGANLTLAAFEREIASRKLSDVVLRRASCIGQCAQEPTVTIEDPKLGKVVYFSLTEDKVPEIVEKHLISKQVIKEWAVDFNSPRFKLQETRVLHNQDIDPESIDEYIARGGYLALGRAITIMKTEGVLNIIKASGLKGRGGGGFYTATKWSFVRNAKGDTKYIICNGDEGDPGAYMNRAVLEGNPHSIIEGMAIGAYCIENVRQGYAYVRAEYPLAIKTLQKAIDQAKTYGLLGKNILGSGFDFDLEIFPGAGAFVCGEETALITSIEGNRGTPRQRPPFPANEGLFGKPTALNNVETWSNIPQIIFYGAEWFAEVGNPNNRGTKTLCLVGKVKNAGLVEVPLGTSLGKIIYDIGGGIQNDKKFKGVQLGGPSGGVIPAQHLNTPVDYDSIPPTGAIMGSGGVVVMDEDSCMVDVAKYFLDFTRDESCGKCISCREGTARMYDLLCKISGGTATMEDLHQLEDLADVVKAASICGLGQTAPNPVLTTLRYFRDEYESHIIDKKCPASVCQALFKAPCQHTCPVGLDVPGYVSLIKDGKFEESYRLIAQKLPFPMSIGRICPAPCRSKCRRSQIDESIQIRHLKRFAADYAFEHGYTYLPEIKQMRNEQVAIIGAGPAGLAAAWDLALEGYRIEVFEALPVAGGMLAVGVPEYRLPRQILDAEIENIKKLGIRINLNHRVNNNAAALLDKGYKAVLVAIGAHRGLGTGTEGEDLDGVCRSVTFLSNAKLGKSEIKMGKNVVVIGGGNSAIDAVRTSLRQGASTVTLVYRRERLDMPAEPEEIEAALSEGVVLRTMTNPAKMVGIAGQVKEIELVKMSAGDFDSSGRRQSMKITGSEFRIPADMVIQATGNEPDISGLLPEESVKKGNWIAADCRTLTTSIDGVFAAGDAFHGTATAIEAIASGQRAASSINRYLKGEVLSSRIERNHQEHISYSTQPPDESILSPRAAVPVSEISKRYRKSYKEVVKSYTPQQAKEEANRCLRCDLSSD